MRTVWQRLTAPSWECPELIRSRAAISMSIMSLFCSSRPVLAIAPFQSATEIRMHTERRAGELLIESASAENAPSLGKLVGARARLMVTSGDHQPPPYSISALPNHNPRTGRSSRALLRPQPEDHFCSGMTPSVAICLNRHKENPIQYPAQASCIHNGTGCGSQSVAILSRPILLGRIDPLRKQLPPKRP
jgi:hypothetical protein